MTLIRVILIKIAIFLALGLLPSAGTAQVEEEREITAFDEVVFKGNWGLILEEGTSPGIKIKAQKAETLEKVETWVEGNKLIVKYPRNKNKGWKRTPKIGVYLTYQTLKKLVVDGKMEIVSKSVLKNERFKLVCDGYLKGEIELATNRFKLDSDGYIKFKVRGQADYVDVSLDGAGKVSALELKTKNAEVDIDGAATVHINAEESLNADLDGFAKLKYGGNPSQKNIRKDGLVFVSKVKSY